MPEQGQDRRPRVLVLGDINVDVLGRLEAPSLVGGDSMSSALEFHLGGVGANTALALARLGFPARLLGLVGQDWFGDFALRVLQNEGVDISSVQQTERAPTGLVFIAVEPGGQRTMFGSRGANREITLPPDRQDYWEGVTALHLVGYAFLSPTGEAVARRLLAEACARSLPASLDVGNDPSRLVPEAILQVASGLDILIVAFDEAMALSGQSELQSIVEALEQRGPRQVILKRGEKGCWFREQGELLNAPAFPVQVVDTTGAGDVFTAALLRARLEGWPWREAAVLANAAGGLAAAVVGAGEQAPALGAVERLLQTTPLPAEWDSVRLRVLERLTQDREAAESAPR
ncbi:MAG: carbohydrate kinase family protein [Acidobacteria bacterium]|nr:carbohydrate kinase family protein [Acidobacteriota bacterium]